MKRTSLILCFTASRMTDHSSLYIRVKKIDVMVVREEQTRLCRSRLFSRGEPDVLFCGEI